MSELNWNELWDESKQRYRVQTRDGRKVRIFVTDAHDSMFPVVGEVECKGGDWTVEEWTANGRHYFSNNPNQPERGFDLIPEPRTVRRWANVYRQPSGGLERLLTYHTKEAARFHMHDEAPLVAGDKYVKTIFMEWEE